MIKAIEQLLYHHFCSIPFHNLHLLYGQPLHSAISGGTCSDKTLAFFADAQNLGANVFLHSANIGGKEIHRLIRLNINGRTFFADVGNGWPTLYLLPADKQISFECFGMEYRTKIIDDWVQVFHKKQEQEALQVEISTACKPEKVILAQIKSRYSPDIGYPFSRSLRFSLIVDNEFLFLRGNRLERYSKSGLSIQNVKPQAIPETIEKEFGFDVSGYFNQFKNGHAKRV